MMAKTATVNWLLGALLSAAILNAQGGPTTLQFSFSNPGARSLGLGGAFVALADDATAAFANPSGLVQLTRPEVSIEGRYWSYATPFTEGGRVSGQPTGIGLDTPLRTSESEFDTSAISFLSFAYPGRTWTVALYRHQLAKFEATTGTQGLFTDTREDEPFQLCLADPEVCRFADIRRGTRVDFVTTAASVAFRLSDSFSIGAGFSYFETDFFLPGDGYVLSDETLPLGFFGPNSYATAGRFVTGTFETDDTDWGLSLGLLWFPTRQWSLGGFFRSGPAATMSVEERSGPALDPPFPEGTILESDPAIPIGFPDVYGLGFAYRSQGGSWTVSFEWDRVEYSTILESIPPRDVIDTREVRLDDADELHLGVEYVFLKMSPIVALRAGVWKDPDHQIRSEEDNPLERALLPGGDDEVHYSMGAGVAFKNLQWDLAVDFSDIVDTASLSLIWAF